MSDAPDDDEFIDLCGMKVRRADWLWPSAFAAGGPAFKPMWIGVDPAGPEGDYSVTIPIKLTGKSASFALLDDIDEQSDRLAMEMRAMRKATDLYAVKQRAMYGGRQTETNWLDQPPRFLMEDMLRILDEMQRRKRSEDLTLIETLIAAGFRVEIDRNTTGPVALLPASYSEALADVEFSNRNRDEAENVYRNWSLWPDQFHLPPDCLADLRDNEDAWRSQYQQEWPLPEDEQDIGG